MLSKPQGPRRRRGKETWHRLQGWESGATDSQRLAGHILRFEGFDSLDPSHPLGGPDGLKDYSCIRAGERWIAGVYFPRGQKRFSAIKKKFSSDLKGLDANNAAGFAFITNQELKESERRKLMQVVPHGKQLLLVHLERLSDILNDPRMCGIRLEFLDIPMDKEEQLAFFASYSSLLESSQVTLSKLTAILEEVKEKEAQSTATPNSTIPLSELRSFREELAHIVGRQTGFGFMNPNTVSLFGSPTIDQLRVPLAELREFSALLREIVGSPMDITAIRKPRLSDLQVPLEQLQSFHCMLTELVGDGRLQPGRVRELSVPLDALRDYEATLDCILEKEAKLGKQR